MERFNVLGATGMADGRWVRFIDHEAAIKKAVEYEREAIVQYLIDQGTIQCGNSDIYCITDSDIAAIRSRGEKP